MFIFSWNLNIFQYFHKSLEFKLTRVRTAWNIRRVGKMVCRVAECGLEFSNQKVDSFVRCLQCGHSLFMGDIF